MKRWSEVFSFSSLEIWLLEHKARIKDAFEVDGKWTAQIIVDVHAEQSLNFVGKGTHMDSALRDAMRQVEERELFLQQRLS